MIGIYTMRILISIIGYIGIIVLIILSLLFLGSRMELEQAKTIMIVSTIVWFGSSVILVRNLDNKPMG